MYSRECVVSKKYLLSDISDPLTLSEDGYEAQFVYDPDGNRKKMLLRYNGSTQLQRYYLGDRYEADYSTGKQRLYIGGDAYSAPAVYVSQGTFWALYYICRDYLGSITQVVNSSGYLIQENSYDAWGRLRDPATRIAYLPGEEPALFLERGYTGHEHLPQFGLIQMNARLYDPAVGRFLAPDPFVQMPGFSQSFNRYSYCLNNPLRYTDPDGEFFLGYTLGFFRGLFTGKNPFKTGWRGGVNEVKIWGGLFTSDSRKNFGKQVWEIFSRFTWQLPQTLVGLSYTHLSNWGGQVDNVDYWGGATVLSGNFFGSTGAVTLGSYISGGRNLAANPNNSIFQHEYGHYLQSQKMGWGYLSRVGLPSLLSANGDGNHKYQPFEQDANRRAFMYFNKNVEGFYKSFEERNEDRGWSFFKNPLDVYHTAERGEYYDYYNPKHIDLIGSLSLKAKWSDYMGWLVTPLGPIATGIGNGIYYKKNRIK